MSVLAVSGQINPLNCVSTDRLWNVQAGVDWAVFEHFGLGLYYNLFILDVDVDQTDWRGKVETTQAGPYLALTATW